VRDLTKQLLEAVYTIHDKEICHRDLKPDNILLKDVDDETFLTLIDFGIGVDFEDGKPIRGRNGV
jgi:serine/threonine protein kinase